jgi:nucleoside-diphosphate-sugar epimerase
MTTLIVGATGATGRLLTKELLDRGQSVRVIVRSAERLPEAVHGHENLEVITASLLDLSDAELAQQVKGCDAVASCLGHNLTFQGMFGEPRKLVTDAARRLCAAVKANAPERPVKYVLMNTTGNWNRDLDEPITFAERIVTGLLRTFLPPHADNEQAADFLRSEIGQDDPVIEWAAVRPDGLIDENEVSAYEVYLSPIRSAIFDAGQTSRINVGHFMAALITEDAVWQQWKGQMPVIYNKQV